ncbi:ATP-binding protein [Sphingomonas sp. UNC305MFCol5.2]|uniref:ATP-binding protein n=1 Tax=Sphingomonas sp. UNC305MFCol5.2 TaxID=1449076 RepID=UPI0004A74C6B|nr:ATP-binding protein [Sphingomonas sp. UNC305MFCol5.2]
MTRALRPSLGLIGRVFAILLLAILIEFGASTFYYERASQLSVRDDEARRLAEHLVIARKLLAEEPAEGRAALAADLTTSRYEVRWGTTLPARLRIAPNLDRIHKQVVEWEPSLAGANPHLRLVGNGRKAVIEGSIMLPDGSKMQFATREPVHELSFSFDRILLGLAPAVLIILIGGMLVRRTLLPMRQLAQAAERVGSDEPEALAEAGPRELRRVIRAFNRMQARIHRLIEDRTQALAAVGHDMRTPLARLRLRADGVEDVETHKAIQSDISEMEAMIGSLLAYLSGEDEAEPRVRVDLAALCQTVADDARDRGGDVRYNGPDHLERAVRQGALKRALVNLVENGVHHAEHVSIVLRSTETEIVLRVQDDGPGIPAESIETVMQPFVRLDQARTRDTLGLGLGLSIVTRAVEAEGGTFILRNRSSGGLSAEIRLPLT